MASAQAQIPTPHSADHSRIFVPLHPVCHPVLVDCAPPPAMTVGLSIGVLDHGWASLMVSALSAHWPFSSAGALVYSPTRTAYGPDRSFGTYLGEVTQVQPSSLTGQSPGAGGGGLTP